MEVLTLYQLNEFIKRVMALNFPDPIWVKGEIAQVSQSNGHYYLQLIEKGDALDEPIVAENRGIIWSRQFAVLKKRLSGELASLLQPGMQVKVKAQVKFQERYGMQLVIEDIDAEFTIGQLELQRLKNIEQLRKEGLLQKNSRLPANPAFQRIALLASPDSAGYRDFVEQLRENRYQYRFQITLFEMNVQGQLVESQALQHLETIAQNPDDFDVLAIIRGGGSRIDLGAFDSLKLATCVANFPLPVLAGIGHETDETLLDLVVYRSLKTPTAVAEHLIGHNVLFEGELEQLNLRLRQKASQYVQDRQLILSRLQASLDQSARASLKYARQFLQSQEALLQALNPMTTLKKGYSLTLREGKILRSAEGLSPGDHIQTRLADGTLESIFIQPEKDN